MKNKLFNTVWAAYRSGLSMLSCHLYRSPHQWHKVVLDSVVMDHSTEEKTLVIVCLTLW